MSIRVLTHTNHPPAISTFNANPTSGYAPLNVSYTYAVSDPDGDPLTCRFDFNGDGVIDKTINNCNHGITTFTFTTPGTYTSRLEVWDGHNATNATINISVLRMPVRRQTIFIDYANLTPSSGYIPVATNLSFALHTNGTRICNVSVNWGDGTGRDILLCAHNITNYSSVLSKTYTHPGTYHILLRAADNNGSIASRTLTFIARQHRSSPSHHGSHHHGGGGGGGFYCSPTVNKGEVIITELDAPSKMWAGEGYHIYVNVKNNRACTSSSLNVSLSLDGMEQYRLESLSSHESKNLSFYFSIPKVMNGTYTLDAKIIQNNKQIDERTKQIVIQQKISKLLVDSLSLDKIYDGSQPINFSYCVSYTGNAHPSLLYVYVDDQLMKTYTITHAGCYSASMGNVFRMGEHKMSLRTKYSSKSKIFYVSRQVYIQYVNIPQKMYVGREYHIPVSITVSTPSHVSIALLQNNKAVASTTTFIVDNDVITLDYTPTTSGNTTIRILAQAGNETDERDINTYILPQTPTGFSISHASTIAGGIVGFSLLAFLALYLVGIL